LDPSATLETFKMILEAETGLASSQQVVMLGGKAVTGDGSTLSQLGFENDCLVIMERRLAPRADTGADASRPPAGAGEPDVAAVNPDGSAKYPERLMSMLAQPGFEMRFPPEMAKAIKDRDVESFQTALRQMRDETLKRQQEEERFMRLAAEDPMNIEVQKRLEEIIRQKNVEENFQNAMEYNPEAFSSVTMLYINATVNGVKLPAFVDSGAQMSIMGQSTAEKCGLLRLMDKRFGGKAVGVGTGNVRCGYT
jgi:DNA damage-inducible protein 1